MGLLDLPQEIRDLILHEVIVKPQNTITMLPDFSNSRNEISACPPSICRVNRQLRQETLPTFYAANVFSAQLDNEHDLATAKRWLAALSDGQLAHLRRLAMCGWTRIPFGHMSYRRWIKVVLYLHAGTMELESDQGLYSAQPADAPSARNNFEELKAAYNDLVQARAGRPFDAASIRRLMDGFNSLCTVY